VINKRVRWDSSEFGTKFFFGAEMFQSNSDQHAVALAGVGDVRLS